MDLTCHMCQPMAGGLQETSWMQPEVLLVQWMNTTSVPFRGLLSCHSPLWISIFVGDLGMDLPQIQMANLYDRKSVLHLWKVNKPYTYRQTPGTTKSCCSKQYPELLLLLQSEYVKVKIYFLFSCHQVCDGPGAKPSIEPSVSSPLVPVVF